VIALVRPEGISITTGGTNGAGDEPLAATVHRHTFLGANTRLGLESALGTLVADVPSTQAVLIPLGSEVHLAFDSAAIRLLPRP
jgi:TOBE domain